MFCSSAHVSKAYWLYNNAKLIFCLHIFYHHLMCILCDSFGAYVTMETHHNYLTLCTQNIE